MIIGHILKLFLNYCHIALCRFPRVLGHEAHRGLFRGFSRMGVVSGLEGTEILWSPAGRSGYFNPAAAWLERWTVVRGSALVLRTEALRRKAGWDETLRLDFQSGSS